MGGPTFRVVAFAVDQSGFGFAKTDVTVQDPVSLDVSMPRFVTPTDKITAKMNVRWNSYEGPVEIFSRIGAEETSTQIEQPVSNIYQLALPLKAMLLELFQYRLKLQQEIESILETIHSSHAK